MRITKSARMLGQPAVAWMLACGFALTPIAAAAQVTYRPTPTPIVTAENESWYLEGQPITFSGSIYYLSGAAVYFNPYEMVRSGEYRGVPLYSLKTREPYAVVFVPVDRGLMQPYERRREGEMAGTVGSTAPAFPVDRDNEATFPDSGLQAMGPPMVRQFYPIYGVEGAYEPGSYAPSPAGAEESAAPRGPLTTALKPTGLNAFYIEYEGRRWFANGPAVLLDQAKFRRSGEYHGFPVYVNADAPADVVYVAVANATTGLVTPYSTKR